MFKIRMNIKLVRSASAKIIEKTETASHFSYIIY